MPCICLLMPCESFVHWQTSGLQYFNESALGCSQPVHMPGDATSDSLSKDADEASKLQFLCHV